jgi:hypothetical protein
MDFSLISCFSIVFIKGSSTDLTPSVIGYYDRLSGGFDNERLIGEARKSPEKHFEDILNSEQSPKPKLVVSKIPFKPPINKSTSSLQSSSRLANSLPKLNSNNFNCGKTLQIISPNVHRMISSHQITTETTTSVKSYLNKTSNNQLFVSSTKRANDKIVNLPTRRTFKNNKPTGIAIPLTKNLSKISQSHGLVDSSEPIVHTITDNNCIKDSNKVVDDSEKTPTNCDHNFNYESILNNNNCIFNDDDDDDNIQNVLNKTSELINNLLSGSNNNKSNNNNSNESESLGIHKGLIGNCENGNDASVNDEVVINQVSKDTDQDITMKSSSNYHNKSSSSNKYHQMQNSDTDEEDGNLKFAKSLDNVAEIDVKLPTSSPKLTYSRAKLLSHQQLGKAQASPTHSPKLSEKHDAITSASDGKLNASPSTKHRPLSAASISSSSSSSSTASSTNSFSNEHMPGGKFVGGMTYLASIESLADHSENEVNPCLTMCERAALEIIDSEKSYVDDLGQIIKG